MLAGGIAARSRFLASAVVRNVRVRFERPVACPTGLPGAPSGRGTQKRRVAFRHSSGGLGANSSFETGHEARMQRRLRASSRRLPHEPDRTSRRRRRPFARRRVARRSVAARPVEAASRCRRPASGRGSIRGSHRSDRRVRRRLGRGPPATLRYRADLPARVVRERRATGG